MNTNSSSKLTSIDKASLAKGTVTISDTTPQQGQTLIAESVWKNTDETGVISYQWLAGGVEIATGNSCTLAEAQVGKTINVVASYTDTRGTVKALSSLTEKVSNINDVPTGSVTIQGAAVQGQTLTATNDVADADGLGVISYAWQVGNGKEVTADSYVLQNSDVGKTISVVAGYTDGHNTPESVISEATAVVTAQMTTVTQTTDISIVSLDKATTGEDGSEVKYSVSLNSQPLDDVVISFVSSDTSEGIIEQATLTFNEDNWNTAQTLVVKGVNDYANDGNIVYSVTATVSSSDKHYDGLFIEPLALTNLDDGREKPLKLSGDLNGAAIKDILIGNDGADRLYGLKGEDELRGGRGADFLYGGLGKDVLYGQLGNDKLYGEDDDDYIDGNGGNDTLTGGTGVDTLVGGQGDDVYYLGEDVADVVDDQGVGGIDMVYMAFQLNEWTLAKGIDYCTITAGDHGDVWGNEENNKIIGNNGPNAITGKVGMDSLSGSGGDDTLDGGTDVDSLSGGLGNDTYFVDDVSDLVVETNPTSRAAAPSNVDAVNSSVNYTLPGSVENLSLSGTAPISATGNELNNVLVGNAGNNVLQGLAGNDLLNGSTGKDSLTGGAGLDVFKFDAPFSSANADAIVDFNVTDDSLQLENAVFTALPTPGTLTTDAFKIGSAAGDNNDRVVYNKTTGSVLYDADGTGSGAAVQITTIGVNLAITNADFVII